MDVNNLLNYRASAAGVARIVLWTLMFLWLAGRLLPAAPENVPFAEITKGTRLRPLATIAEDPRFLRDDLSPLPGRRVTWITDSTSVIFPPDRPIPHANYNDVKLIPALVLDHLNKPPRRGNVNIDLNIQLGLRSLESFSSVIAAVESRPDLIVMSFNPAWMLSSHEIHKREAHLNRASALWSGYPQSWPWLFVMTSPANHAWAAMAQHFPVLRSSALYKGQAEKLASSLTPQKTAAPKPVAGQIQLVKSGVVFWVCLAELLPEDCGRIILPGGGLDTKLWYRELLKLADLTGRGMALLAWQRSLEILHDSGIPVLVYAIPVPDTLREDSAAYEKMQQIHEMLSRMGDKYKGSNIHVIPQMPADVVRSATFRSDDAIHPVKPGRIDDYLAERIWHILRQVPEREATP